MPILRKYLIKANNVQVVHGRHDVGVAFCVVHGGFAAWEGGWGPEPAVGVAEVTHGRGAFVVGGGVGDEHVFFAEGDIFLGRWHELLDWL